MSDKLVIDQIKENLSGKIFKYVPLNGAEPYIVKVSNGKVYLESDVEFSNPLRLVGVRWTYLQELYNKENGIETPVADPMKDVVGKNASGVSKEGRPVNERKANNPSKQVVNTNTYERVTYWTTQAQKQTVLAILDFIKIEPMGEEYQAGVSALENLRNQWDESALSKPGSLAYLSYEECIQAGKIYDALSARKSEFKSITSLISKTQWVMTLKFD